MVLGFFHDFICNYLPNTLKNLPIPAKFTDLKSLSFRDLIKLTVFCGVSGGIGYCICFTFRNRVTHRRSPDGLVNLTVEKESGKVVNCFNIEELPEKSVLCRCWRSKKFPYCDGSHVGHNTETGDNVGPLIINKK